jgi:transketolase C-terminal domain/subunit
MVSAAAGLAAAGKIAFVSTFVRTLKDAYTLHLFQCI